MMFLTIIQSFQLIFITPCSVIILYLLASRKRVYNLVPAAYFGSLMCASLYQILPADKLNTLGMFTLRLGESFATAFAYLLVLQLLLHRTPKWYHFLICLVPAAGASSFIYLTLITKEICYFSATCVASEAVFLLYQVVSSSFVFMLLLFVIRKHLRLFVPRKLFTKPHYWLIISVICWHLCALGIDLLYAANMVSKGSYELAGTILRIGFMYLVLSSLFRVFVQPFITKKVSTATRENEEKMFQKILDFLELEKPYHTMGFNRAMLAEAMGIKEYAVSHLVNDHAGKSVTEFLNELRVHDTKELLTNTTTPITTIAYDTGFNSVSTFNRVFKNMTGLSPTKYRQKHRKPYE